MYFVYMLRCADDSIYTGITTDPVRRFREHTGEAPNGAKFTHSHRPKSVEALWNCSDRSTASKLEYAIKRLRRPQKLKLISDEAAFAELFGNEMAALYIRTGLPEGTTSGI